MLLALFSGFQAALGAGITITENQGIHFNRILSTPNRSCVMDALTGALSGQACYDTSGTRGVMLIKGDPSAMVDLELIPGASSNNLTFTPGFEGGGLVRSEALSSTGSKLVNIGGTLETDPVIEPASGPVVLTYTLRVNYQ